MDGTGRRVLLSRDLTWPNALTLDLPAGRLYYMDALHDTAHSVTLDGHDRKLLLANSTTVYSLQTRPLLSRTVLTPWPLPHTVTHLGDIAYNPVTGLVLVSDLTWEKVYALDTDTLNTHTYIHHARTSVMEIDVTVIKIVMTVRMRKINIVKVQPLLPVKNMNLNVTQVTASRVATTVTADRTVTTVQTKTPKPATPKFANPANTGVHPDNVSTKPGCVTAVRIVWMGRMKQRTVTPTLTSPSRVTLISLNVTVMGGVCRWCGGVTEMWIVTTLRMRFQCDGDDNCGDGSDEDEHSGCHTTVANTDDNTTIANTTNAKIRGDCDSDEFECIDGECIQLNKACNNVTECYDQTDEHTQTCSKCSVVLFTSEGQIPTTAIAVRKRRLFYCVNKHRDTHTDDDDASLLSANLDGTRVMEVFGGKMVRCGSVAVDETKHRVYWTDTVLNTIETVDWHGNKHRVVDSQRVVSPLSLVVSGDWLVWANAKGRHLVRCKKNKTPSPSCVVIPLSNAATTLVSSPLPPLPDVVMVHTVTLANIHYPTKHTPPS
ncbi:hypothetical protein Pmani_014786 [Petrolisthes manimaculis]|uniref:Vitellogenin receptor n=1 Tax=Petrolisthes manimaculis TaxID=1843537 RepID=A0AAE1PV36_9EUCA|nr:hypothetical protein Pmani_014786 [Petrolisthes manimaculis]